VSAVVTEHLTKRYGDLIAVDNLSFEVPSGQLLAVLGPNGAGKTTTLEMLEGFIPPTSGTIRVLGADPRRGGRAWRARVGLVLQSTSLDKGLTVAELLSVFGRAYPAPRPVGEVLDIVDLAGEAQTKVGVLSGGQRRRVDLAIGIIGCPDILFLDEPTTGLDPEARRHAWLAVENLTSSGTTVVLTTHYIDEADYLADRVMVISAGQIIADTTPQELRAAAGVSTLSYPLTGQAIAAGLPPALSPYLDAGGRGLVVRTADLSPVLGELVRWAEAQQLGLAGLQVGPPSLEEAYLAITGDLTRTGDAPS
jgi:ABC-2 type transport system ATP-binding protein